MLNTFRKQRWTPRVTMLLFFWSYGVQAQIVPDGRTQTSVAVSGNVSDVTTATTNGENAYNSFSEFSVFADNVVNLHLPGSTENLLNLVHDQATSIDGMLNAIKDGQVGGNVYFANPHGFVVGANGVVNVGSLSVSTPTSQFMDEFFTTPGVASIEHTNELINYTMPLSDSGLVSIQGRVNAVGDVDLRAGRFDSAGLIQSGAVFEASAPTFADVVNLADVESGTELSVSNGAIRIVSGGDVLQTGTIASKGGDISVAGRNITINGGAEISAASESAGDAGDVLITASHLLGAAADPDVQAASSVTMGSSTVRGRDVTVAATAANARDQQGSAVTNELLGGLNLIDLNAFEAGGVQVGSVATSSSATVDIGAGARLLADRDLTLSSSADSEARTGVLELAGVVLPVGVGGAYAKSDAVAETTVGAGATLAAGNLIDVDAEAGNVVEVSSRGLDKGTILLSVAEVTTDSDARIASGATVSAHAVDIDAASTSDIQNSTGPIAGVGANGGGITATWLRSTADAEMAADADLNGDLDVNALSETTRNTTFAKSQLKPGILSDKVTKIRKLFSSTAKATKVPGGAASAFAISDSEHVANASIGAGADIDAANVRLGADTEDNFKLIAGVDAETTEFALGSAASVGDHRNEANAFVGENATVDAGEALAVEAKNRVPSPVNPEVLYFWQADNFFDGLAQFLGIVADPTGSISEAFLTTSSIAQSQADEGTGIAGMHVNLNVDNDANAYIASGAAVNVDQSSAAGTQTVDVTATNEIDAINLAGGLGSGNTLGGAVNDLNFDVDVKAAVADGAVVNAREDVNVTATSRENLVNIAVAGGSAEAFGLVGSVNLIDVDNNVQAVVDDQARVHAGRDANITATDTANNIAVSGGVVKGASTGIGFSWAVNRIKSVVRAFFGDDTEATTPGTADPGQLVADNNVNIAAEATQNQDSWSLAASAGGPGTGDAKSTAKGSAGFGASGDVSLNSVDGETTAFIDDGVAVDAGFIVNVTGTSNAQLNARSGSASLQSGAGSSGIAGSYSENAVATAVSAYIDDATIVKRDDGSYTVVEVAATSNGGISSIAVGGGGSGKIGVAGSVAVNEIGSDDEEVIETAAYIGDATLERANVEVSATDNRSIDSFTGAVSVSGTAGIGPSVSINNTSNDTHAYLDGAVIEEANSVGVTAFNDNAIQSISASAGVGTTSFGGAGSLSHNTIDNSAEAYARNTRIDTALHDVTLDADDTSSIFSIAGGGAFGSSIGVAVSAAYNDIANRVRAFLDGSSVTTDGSVLVTADSDADIDTVGVGIGASGSVGVAGSTAINKLHNEVSAEIANGSTVAADDNVQVAAANENELLVIAGTGSGGGSAGGGGAVVVNIVDNDTTARIAGSNVSADANGAGVAAYSGETEEGDENADATLLARGVVVDAYSREDITSANFNGAGGGTAGVAASTSVTTVKDTTTAAITGSDINQVADAAVDDASPEQQVRVAAYERVEFGGGSGSGAGGGSAGVGVGIDAAVVQNTTEAYVSGNSRVNARQAIDVAAAHRQHVLSASVGGAGGGAAGVVGSGNGARLASTTRAYAAGSELRSGGDIGVTADETAELVQIAGGIAGGGVAGVTGAVGVGIVENTTEAYLGNGAVTNAADTTRVQADSEETIDHFVISGSGGGTVGVAANVSVKTANSTTRAFIDGGASVNQDDTVGSTEQDVSVRAESDLTLLGATGGASGGGVVGGGAAIDLDFVKNTTSAYIGDGASVSAGRDVTVEADAHKDVTSFAVGGGGGGTVGVSAMVSVVNIGARLDEESKGEVGNAGSYADDQVSGNTTRGIDGSDGFASAAATEAANDNGDTTVSGDVNETSTESLNRTSAFLGDLAVVDAGRDVTVSSVDRTDVTQNVGGIAVSLGGAVGGSVGIVNTNTYNQARIGSGARVNGGGLIEVAADTDNDVVSTGIAGAGGLVGLGAAVAIANDTSVTLAGIGDGAVIDEAGDVSIAADADVDLDTFAFGATAGAGAVGASVARSRSEAITRALVSDGVMIGQAEGLQVGGLDVGAVSDVDADAWAIAGSAGIVSGSGADARSDIVSTTHSQIGQGSHIDVAGNLDVSARGLTQGEARADGVNVAGITVGMSQAQADSTPEVLASIGDQTSLTSGGNLTLAASHNTDEFGTELTARKMHARAFSAAGALLGGVGSDARSSVAPDVDAALGLGAHLDAGGDAVIEATTVARAEADASGQAFGAGARGVTRSQATVDAHTDVTTAADVIVEAGSIVMSAIANLFADADTTGGNGGLLSLGGTKAKARIDNATAVTLGPDNTLAADGSVLVEAVSALDAYSNASVGAGGAVTINQVSADTDIVNTTSADVGEGSTLSGIDVTVQALVEKLRGYARARSTTFAAGSDSEARSYVDVESTADVSIGPGAELRGQNSVSVTARTSGIDIDSIADAKIGGGLTGNLLAIAHGDLDVDSDVDIQEGAIVTAPHITLLAETVSNDGDFNRNADAEANTVVNWVLQKSTTLVRKAEKIPFIGWFFKWVRKTVFTWVADVLQSDVSAQVVGGDPRTDNSIAMNGTLAQLSALSPTLTVNADQTISSDGNINAEIANGEVVVNGVNNNVVGTIDISSPGGTVSGAGTLLLNKTFDSVDITNNSALDMRINNVDVLAANADDPELNINADLDLTTFDIVSEVEVSDVNVLGTTEADIIVAGDISNPAGITTITNVGDIYGDGGSIEANRISLASSAGDVGQAGNLIRLNLIRDFDDAQLTVLAGGSAYLHVQLAEYLDDVPAGHVIDGLAFQQMVAGADMVLHLRSGVVFDLPEEPGLEPVPVAVLGNYSGGELAAGGDLSITEEALADFRYDLLRSTNGSVALALDNGDAAITRIEALNGGVSVDSAGAIQNGSTDGRANIAAVGVDLTADGGIGTAAETFEIDQGDGGFVNASAAGDVYLASESGGFGIGLIDALGHYVSLMVNGSLLDGNDEDSENILAETIELSSAGAVGAADRRLVVGSGDGPAAVVDVDAGSGIHLEGRSGNLVSSSMTSASGSVDVLIADGSGALASVSAPDQVAIAAPNGSLAVGTIDPAAVMLSAGGVGSTIDVNAMQASSSIRASAEHVNLDHVTHTGGADSTLDMDITGDLSAASIASAAGGIDLAVSGGADIGVLTAATRLDATAGDMLEIDDVRAPDLALAVAAEGGSLHVVNAQASDTAAFSGDVIAVDRLLDTDDGSLQVTATGNDGGIAGRVDMQIDTLGSLLFDVFKSVYSSLFTSSNDVTFEHLVVGELFEMETDALRLTLDYKDNKDNENSENLVTRDQPVRVTVDGTRVRTEDTQNLFVIKEKL